MKTSWLILVLICAGPLFTQSDAAAQNTVSRSSTRNSAETKNSKDVKHITTFRGGKHATIHSAQLTAKANHSKSYANGAGIIWHQQFPNNRSRLMGNRNLSQTDSIKTVTHAGPVRNKRANSALPVRSSALLPTSSPTHNPLRHRGANAAVVGGYSPATNTATINGTLLTRRP